MSDGFELTEEDVKFRYVTPALEKSGWPKKQLHMEYATKGRIIIDQYGPVRSTECKKLDYHLISRSGRSLAVVEAKKEKYPVGQGIQQAIEYAKLVDAPFAYSTNGHGFLEHDMLTGEEKEYSIDEFPTEDVLWGRYLTYKNFGVGSSLETPFYTEMGWYSPRYYQRVAINRVLEAVENKQKRILLVMATGTGKTYVSMQIIHRLMESGRSKRILFLVDRNKLVDQTMANDFKHFNKVMTKVQNRSMESAYPLQLALYQQLVDNSKSEEEQPYRQFKPEFYDTVIVDECHRGSASEDSEWRKILDYFKDAIHIGLTATPKEDKDISTSKYFGQPVYTYSFKQGVEDGFLAPFRVKSYTINIDDEWYPDTSNTDQYGNQLEGPFDRRDYDRRVIVKDRTALVAENIVNFLRDTDPFAKTIVFCTDTYHAQRMRDAIAALVPDRMREDPRYVMRITGDDEEGLKQLDNFTDKRSRYPVIVTTSELLTTGVDCFMTKIIAIDKTIASATEFKQIIGRGSRLDTEMGKWFFTILDFKNAVQNFIDGWDGPPLPPEEPSEPGKGRGGGGKPPEPGPHGFGKIEVQGHVPVEIQIEIDRKYGPNGEFTTEDIIDYSKKKMLGFCPTLSDFLNEWNSNDRKKAVLEELENHGVLVSEMRSRVGRQDLDDFDMLCHLVYGMKPMTKTERVDRIRDDPVLKSYGDVAKQVLDIIIEKYCNSSESDLTNMDILTLNEFKQFGSIPNIVNAFGGKDSYLNAVRTLQNLIYS